ncbi:MAG: hypothetical protein J7J38_03140 [Candidatus Aenigmarchaeota archaeon]|nr:hypothetical protein [Candidatus Aenigmarchaeota archaeon]
MFTVLVSAIIIIILISIVVFYAGKLTSSISDADAWNRGCGIWKARGCINRQSELVDITIAGYDPDGDGKEDNLQSACRHRFGYTDTEDCWKACCGSAIR